MTILSLLPIISLLLCLIVIKTSVARAGAVSLAIALGPTLILMGTIATKQEGQESLVYKKLVAIVLLVALIMGIINYILLEILRY